LRIGDIDVQALRHGAAIEFAGDVLSRPDVLDAWRCHPDQFGAEGPWSFPLGAFVIRTGDRIILVDAGAGTHDDGRYVSGSLLASLRIHGLQPSDVTDVVFTQLHWDHVGWTTHGGDVVFPAATYRVHHADWERFVAGPTAVPAAIDKLMPIAPQLELFESDITVAPGIDAVHSPGHTPGSAVYVLSSVVPAISFRCKDVRVVLLSPSIIGCGPDENVRARVFSGEASVFRVAQGLLVTDAGRLLQVFCDPQMRYRP
jgi:hypothetical protein